MDQHTAGLIGYSALGLGAVFCLWLNHWTGWAHLDSGPWVERRKHPILFWLVQAFFGGIAIMCVIGFFVVAFGSE